jgi:prephenate dehydratase
MKKIAFLGPKGTVSEESARYFFEDTKTSYELVPYKLISDLFMATVSEDTDFSVIPIENTIDSSVTLHLDWLVHEVDLPIQAEWIYPSIQNLIGNKEELQQDTRGSNNYFSNIKKIVSIPVAIAQCQKFLKKYLPHVEFEHMSSTAEGVKYVKEHPGEGLAAIGTSLASQCYGLDLLSERITDHHNNHTRFILVGQQPLVINKSVPPVPKTTILITLPEDYPGALHQVLSAFAWRKINLSKIESRPTKKKLGNYYFYIDIEQSLDSVLLPAALSEIEAIGCQVRILGSYPSYSYETKNSEV